MTLLGCPSSRSARPDGSAGDGSAPTCVGADCPDAARDSGGSRDGAPVDAGGLDGGRRREDRGNWCSGTCTREEDCCVAEIGRPCGHYPNSSRCVDGICSVPTCDTDAECDTYASGAVCLLIDGFARCLAPCENDDDCEEWGRCLPIEDGRRTCRLVCRSNEDCCLEPGPCRRACTAGGECVCLDDEACRTEAFPGLVCIEGTCTCTDDESCASNRYPFGLEPRCVPVE